MKKISLLLLLAVSSCGQLSHRQGISRSALDDKTAFDHSFPSYVAFRGESKRDTTYEMWAKKQKDADVIISKFLTEEIELNPKSAEWAAEYVSRNPGVLLLDHLNGQARQTTGHHDVLDRYFPGHWVYMPGSKLVSDVSPSETVFKVEDARPFASRGYHVPHGTADDFYSLVVLIVKLGPDGERLWYESEYATVAGYDTAAGTVTLNRGQYSTKPISFKGGETYIAPMNCTGFGAGPMWFYNFSSVCPRDRNGKTAQDLYLEEIAGWFGEGGPLEKFDGIGFDVNYFDRSGNGRKMDVNNDGVADAGWIDGRNVWLDGDLQFLIKVREIVSDKRVITCDGQLPFNQQTPVLLNGMESEGLIEPNDSWRGFSRAVNTHLFWENRLTRENKLRYVVMKVNGKDEPRASEIRPFSAATAFCLGAAVTSSADKGYVPERFRTPGSLGHIVGELIRPAKSAEPLVTLSGEELFRAIDQTGCTARLENGKVYVKPIEKGDCKSFSFKICGVPVPDGDLTVFATARAVEPLTDFAEEFRIPRFFYLKPANLPEYDPDPRYDEFFTELYGMIDTVSPLEMSFFFRDMSAAKTDFCITVSGTGETELTSVAVYNSPDVLIREFENGVIAVNPSDRKVVLDMSEFVPGLKQKSIEISPVGTIYLEKK